MDEQPKDTARQERVYGAPRRFGIGTLLIVTTAFAVAMAILTALGVPSVAVVVILTFVALVGVSQAVLFGGTKPRLASAIAGFGALELFVLTAISLELLRDGRASAIGQEFCSGTCVCAIYGPILGYATGGMVAGLFLVTDKIEQSMRPRKSPGSDRSDPFDSA